MELSFSELRAKEVINTQDGRKLGKVCDIVLCYPDNRWIGIVVPNGRGFSRKADLFIELKNIVKIGEDVVLVNIGMPKNPSCGKRRHGMPIPPPSSSGTGGFGSGGFQAYDNGNGRNYEEYE